MPAANAPATLTVARRDGAFREATFIIVLSLSRPADDAFFRQSLHPGADFKNAFDHARVLIHRWEVMDRAVPSNPKGSFGSALVGKSRAVLCHER